MRRLGAHSRELARTLLSGLVMVLCAGADAASIDDLLPPEQAFITETETSAGEILLHWKIAPGYYVYRDRFRFSSESESLLLKTAIVPPGQPKHDDYFGEVEILRDSFTIALPYDVSNPGGANLTVVSQGCSDLGVCYPPYEQSFAIGLAGYQDTTPDFSMLTAGIAGDSEFLPPDQAFALSARFREDGAVVAEWQIADGYYLYREKFAVILPAGSGRVIQTVELPPGLKKSDDYFGEVEVFYQQAQVVVILAPMESREAPLELDIVYQGCADAGLCYPPISKLILLEAAAAP